MRRMLRYLIMLKLNITRPAIKKILIAFMLLTPSLLYASKDPIEIESDHAEYYEKDGFAKYTGNVEAIQEDKKLNSDELHMHNRGTGFDLFIAKGHEKRALLTNLKSASNTIGTGKANTIVYDSKLDKIDFIGNAEVNQDGYIITGEFLTYFFEEQKLVAPNKGKRTKVVLPAEDIKG